MPRAMPKQFHLQRPDLGPAIAEALSHCDDLKAHQRLLAMRMAASGEFAAAQIATQVGASRRQFFNWVKALKAGGVAGLLQRQHKGGAKPRVTGKVREEFQAGLQQGRWKRAKEIQHWLRREHQVSLALPGVYYCGWENWAGS